MAFYPDELSPIEKLRSVGKPSELSDLNLVSMNRRQWKSMVLGKKDLGINNFATIAEEKEEDISSDGSNAGCAAQNASDTLVNLPNKKITFPKPRRYITSRVADRKEEEPLKSSEMLKLPVKESVSDKKIPDDLSKIVNNPKMNLPEVRQLIKGKKSAGEEGLQQDILLNYTLHDLNVEKQWNQVAVGAPMLTGWPKHEEEKARIKEDKKTIPSTKTQSKKLDEKKSQHESRARMSKTQVNAEEKSKSLNMKDVVNVYKNLTYGTKDEIKSFVEKLSLVEDEEKVESDKNLLSMMNLKALETKIKDLEKKTGQAAGQSKKRGKTGKKTRKIHSDNLARHKVVKVPATLDYTYSPESRNLSYASGGSKEQRKKTNEEKVPWKYVGTQSVLDKSYFVYPSYPQPERRKSVKKSDPESKKTRKEGREEVTQKGKPSQTKVKQSKDILIREGMQNGGSRSVNAFAVTANHSSAATVCTVEFRPETERKSFEAEPSLLVYLHGTKATFVKSPYSYRQFSRVKFFRKDEARAPLIRGIKPVDPNRNVDKRSNRVCDLLDFEEDIQNINEFLLSQNQSGGAGQGIKRAKNSLSRRKGTRGAGDGDSLIEEISRDIGSLQYLPDTEENRKIIGHFFDELERWIDRSKARKLPGNDNNNDANNCLIPIVGY